MMKKTNFVIICAVLAWCVVQPASAQDRFDNRQYSLNVGTMSVPQPSFTNLVGGTMEVQDLGNMFPWNVSIRFEREKMLSDKLGWGWSYGGGLRHTGWRFTIPAGTPSVGFTGLPQDEEWRLKIGLFGFTLDAGAFVSLHLTSRFEVYGGAGAALSRYWEVGSSAQGESREDDGAGGVMSEDASLASTLLGVYGLGGVKLTFNEDYFISLSARYVYGFDRERAMENDIEWDGPFYRAHAKAPFTGEFMILLGIGIMLEG